MVEAIGNIWSPISRADARGYGLYQRHYSFVRRNGGGVDRLRQFGLLGEYLALMTPEQNALFVWSLMKREYRLDGQYGLYCSIFRNEGHRRSSELILAAEELAIEKWGNQRMFTFVAPDKIASVNPGYCFKVAGWSKCGESKRGLHILEKMPH